MTDEAFEAARQTILIESYWRLLREGGPLVLLAGLIGWYGGYCNKRRC
jgi:hypothetical protein